MEEREITNVRSCCVACKRGLQMDNDIVLLKETINILLTYMKKKGITFYEILQETGLQNKEYHDIFEKISYTIKCDEVNKPELVTVNKSQIRRLLGRWNPKLHSMPIDKVVMDIIEKVKSQELGLYCYWSEQKVGKEKLRFEYELFVEKEESR